MALMDQSTFYIGNDAGNAHLALACRLKTYIIHGGSPPYSHTVYKNYYPREFLNNLKPILPPDGVIRNPMLRTIDTVSQEKGMDLIKPKDVVKKILKIHHPIVREVLKLQKLKKPQIEITTLTDIPAGTGLGSSGSFTTALIKSLYAHNKKLIHPQELAELACHIEIDRLREPIGKQDQYISSYGGVTCFTFKRNGKVIAKALKISHNKLTELEDNLLLFFQNNLISMSNNIIYNKQETKLEADRIEVNISTKEIKILMYDKEEKIKILYKN